MTTRIPLPGMFGDGLLTGAQTGSSIMDAILKNKRGSQQLAMEQELLPIQKLLLEAQTQEASGKGSLATQKADILGSIPGTMQNQNRQLDFKNMPPEQAAVLKAFLGLDPYMRSPEYLSELSIEESKNKELMKQNLPKEPLTSGAQTDIQKQISDLDVVIPLMEDLIESVSKGIGEGPREFSSKVTDVVDRYISSVKSPKDQETRRDIKKMLDVRWNETANQYKKRVRKILENQKEVRERLKGNIKANQAGVDTGQLTRREVSGKVYMVPEEKLAAFDAKVKEMESQ